MMLRTITLALAMTALVAVPATAQDQSAAPAEATAPAMPPAAEAPAAPAPKRSLADKMAIAAGIFGAGFAAYKLLKQGKSDGTPAAPESTPQANAQ